MKGRIAALLGALVLVVVVAAAAAGGALSGGDRNTWMSGHAPMMSASSLTERDFLVEMVAHHEEAIVAAGELARSPRPEMRAFGRAVIATQSAQVDQMRGWLEQWYPGEGGDAAYQPMMRDLAELRGDALDRAFLQDMVPHHMMAVMMSQRLLMTPAAATRST